MIEIVARDEFVILEDGALGPCALGRERSFDQSGDRVDVVVVPVRESKRRAVQSKCDRVDHVWVVWGCESEWIHLEFEQHAALPLGAVAIGLDLAVMLGDKLAQQAVALERGVADQLLGDLGRQTILSNKLPAR